MAFKIAYFFINMIYFEIIKMQRVIYPLNFDFYMSFPLRIHVMMRKYLVLFLLILYEKHINKRFTCGRFQLVVGSSFCSSSQLEVFSYWITCNNSSTADPGYSGQRFFQPRFLCQYDPSFLCTGCSLNIVFFFDHFIIIRTPAFLSFPSVSVCVHTPGRQNTSAKAELTEFRKITKF